MSHTTRSLHFTTRGGLPFTVPEGAAVEIAQRDPTGRPVFYWINPAALPRGSIERHDATHYGLVVSPADVSDPLWDAIKETS